MPSLRRSLSSSIAASRSSPYSTSLSEHAAALRAQGSGGGHRRPSGAESTGRRVLADIEWWRVMDGQCMFDPEHSSHDIGATDPETDPEQIPPRITSERAQQHQASDIEHSVPWDHLTEAVLSVVPTTPQRSHHSRDSSTSSLESTPEIPEATIEGMRLDLEYLDLGVHDPELPPYTNTRGSSVPAYPTVGAQSLVDFLSLPSDSENTYADFSVSPLSSHIPAIFN